jgi:hypothetical protein
MRRSRLLLLVIGSIALAAALVAEPVGAYCGDPSYVSSSTEVNTTVHGPLSSFDFEDTGAGAISSISDNGQSVSISYNFSVGSALLQRNGFFDLDTSVSGSTDIVEFSSYGAGATAIGEIGDCLTFGGHAGTGRAHIPIHVTGGATIGWTISGQYMLPANVQVQFRILCGVLDVSGFGDCPDLELQWTTNQTVDTTFDVTFPFTFGTPIGIALQTRLGSAVGYAANGSPGFLSGFANVGLHGDLGPMTVTDAFGTPLATVTLVSDSGYDYLPEPDALLAAGASFAALALHARRRQSFAITRSA